MVEVVPSWDSDSSSLRLWVVWYQCAGREIAKRYRRALNARHLDHRL